MRLIDAELAQRIADKELYFCEAGAVQFVLSHTPTIDAVPVVRCKDCKHYEPHGNGKAGLCPKRKGLARADDYCSYGEQKDGEA